MPVADPDPAVAEDLAADPRQGPAYMARAVLMFNEQVERIGEVVFVIALGALLATVAWEHANWWLVALLLLVVRPAAVGVGLAGSDTSRLQRWLIGWFGIRGVGSIYYLMYAINHGLDPAMADRLVAAAVSVVVVSIVVHGTSVTPLMAIYERRRRR